MSQKIIKIGSSLGVTLRSSMLKQAGLKQGDHVQVSFDKERGSIVVENAQQAEFARSVAKAMDLVADHRDELAKLDNQ